MNLTVTKAPKIVNLVDQFNQLEDTNATLTCSVGSGELEGLSYEWYKDDRKITPSSGSSKMRITVLPDNFQSILRVFNLKSIDSGTYSCIAKNSYGQDRTSTKLNVKGEQLSDEPIDNGWSRANSI